MKANTISIILIALGLIVLVFVGHERGVELDSLHAAVEDIKRHGRPVNRFDVTNGGFVEVVSSLEDVSFSVVDNEGGKYMDEIKTIRLDADSAAALGYLRSLQGGFNLNKNVKDMIVDLANMRGWNFGNPKPMKRPEPDAKGRGK
ncbi:MAG: hypothetical protein JRJ54_15955 [Deltaproteobacteria bacterium]|nr:hypothetical protein [Deltaproteobacteria bacterium]